MQANLLHGVPQCSRIFYDMSEEESNKRGKAVEARALSQPQNHTCALQLGKHHGITVIARKTQTETQSGMEGVRVDRNTYHADTGTNENGGHIVSQALHNNVRALGVVRLQGR